MKDNSTYTTSYVNFKNSIKTKNWLVNSLKIDFGAIFPEFENYNNKILKKESSNNEGTD